MLAHLVQPKPSDNRQTFSTQFFQIYQTNSVAKSGEGKLFYQGSSHCIPTVFFHAEWNFLEFISGSTTLRHLCEIVLLLLFTQNASCVVDILYHLFVLLLMT